VRSIESGLMYGKPPEGACGLPETRFSAVVLLSLALSS